ncbi:MAG: hypothetical protein COT92_03550 [Candidatus Doudnabacteria bacterium CG10_big_fil_rev_8_21_14_0_10_42_18]|uniref:Peptidase C39 domain-containing protein n=1 Tax=Candidatus Doudnabacteria bacterium CG10_big_fil_rev_8_21_14_0_10_42_18 TaxID=1974552 RepID=A0A2H0VA43_9BACT|nr:MAG: hypothetical protein COT92_03550 [Candidatus Doudnabacteria bacterium CG10_big_fil_rev_8_21_14_0_10_42_18]
MKLKIPYHQQKTVYNCGPASLQIVFDYFHVYVAQSDLAKKGHTNKNSGTSHKDMIKLATANNFFCYVNNDSQITEITDFLARDLPVIINYIEPSDNDSHYAVVSGITHTDIILNDPWNGKNFSLSRKEFENRWHDSKNAHKKWLMVLSKEKFELGKQYLPK